MENKKAKKADSGDRSLAEPAAWLAQHGDALYRYAYYRIYNKEVAEDLVQETLLAAWRAHDNFRGESAERTWLTGILKHKIIDYLRRAHREVAIEDLAADADAVDRLFDPDTGDHWRVMPTAWEHPDGALENREFWDILRDCLAALPPQQAAAFAATEIEGLTVTEFCKDSSISATNLYVTLHRARLRLRECLEQNWFERESPRK